MHRTSSGGTYRLDRTFPGVGRIAKASAPRRAPSFITATPSSRASTIKDASTCSAPFKPGRTP